MESITFTCEVITPMFLAGADGTTPELRPASIKGALRFWWRAMNGHLVGKNGDLTPLKDKEAEIFGGSGEGHGRSKVLIRVIPPFPELSHSTFLPYKPVPTYNNKYRLSMLDYLAYGISTYDKNSPNKNKNTLQRKYINVGEIFKIEFKYQENVKDELARSLYLLSEFGGLGAKSRNGFGCFKIKTNKDFLEKVDISTFSKKECSPFHSLSKLTKIYDSDYFNSWDDTLKHLGDLYQGARQDIEKWHDYSKRELISAPIIVRENGRSVQKSFLDRLAKPYFLHVSKDDDGQYFGTILSMPDEFLKFQPDYNHSDYSELHKLVIKDFDDLIF